MLLLAGIEFILVSVGVGTGVFDLDSDDEMLIIEAAGLIGLVWLLLWFELDWTFVSFSWFNLFIVK